MGTYTIPDSQIRKRKRGIILNALWGVALGVFLYLKVHGLIIPLVFGGAFSAFMIFTGWLHNKEFFYRAPRHSLSISDEKMILKSPGSKAETELSTIEKIYVNMRGKNPKPILLVRKGNLKEHLPDYSDLAGLIKEFEEHLGPEKIKYKKWFHV